MSALGVLHTAGRCALDRESPEPEEEPFCRLRLLVSLVPSMDKP